MRFLERRGELGIRQFPIRDEQTGDDPMANDPQTSMDAAKKAQGRKIAPPPSVARMIAPSQTRRTVGIATIEDQLDKPVALKFGFIGTGQGGSRIADAFWRIGYRRVVAFNTTDADFAGLADEIPKLSLQVGGAAKDSALARQQLKGREEDVNDLFVRGWGADLEWAIVCASLGGGTGSGTAWPLVEIARKYMVARGKEPRVGAVVSLPNPSEGQQLARNAIAAFHELWKSGVSPIIVIDNKKIQEIYQPAIADFHNVANSTIASLLHLFNEKGGSRADHITFDRSELMQLLAGGIVVMGAAEIPVKNLKSPADVSAAIREDLTNNVLARCDLSRAKKGACIFDCEPAVAQQFSMDYFEAGFSQLDRIVGSAYSNEDVHKVIHRGLYAADTEGLQCYTLISELEPPHERLQELVRVAGISEKTRASLASFLGVDG